MKNHLWQYVMSINPFIKKEEIESIEELNDWDLLIIFTDGRKVVFDTYMGTYRNVFYNDVNELTEEQEKREFAYRLRSIMGRRGFSQTTLAEALGTSQTMISRYITGESIPSALMLRKIAKVLDYPMDDFFYKEF